MIREKLANWPTFKYYPGWLLLAIPGEQTGARKCRNALICICPKLEYKRG